jgi:hypothetical protein
MNVDEMFEAIIESQYPIDESFSMSDLTNFIIESGNDITAFSQGELDQLLNMCLDAQESVGLEMDALTECGAEMDALTESGTDVDAPTESEFDSESEMETPAQDKRETEELTNSEGLQGKRDVAFGAAGKCYRCYGTGVIWNFSEGMNEKCYVCGGSGIGPE